MPIRRLITAEASQEEYEAGAAIVEIDHEHPLGLIMHGAAELNGKIQVAEVWDSEEYLRRFDEERLQRAIEAAGVQRNDEQTIFELHQFVTP